MNNKQIAQKVISFEYSRINSQSQALTQYQNNHNKYHQRYMKWNLATIIKDMLQLNQSNSEIYWIGYGKDSLILAFIYCLFNGHTNNTELAANKYTYIKHILYLLSQQYLNLPQQKLLVQNLCYSQYTKNIANYLSKNSILEQLIQKIFKQFIKHLISLNIQNQSLLPLQEIKLFALNFMFISFQIINQTIGSVTSHQNKHYIVVEKQCVFVVQVDGKQGKQVKQEKEVKVEKVELTQSNGKGNTTFMLSSLKTNGKNSHNNSNGGYSKLIQCSTPKFLPLFDQSGHKNSINNSSSKKATIIQQIQTQNFQQKLPNSSRYYQKNKYYINGQTKQRKFKKRIITQKKHTLSKSPTFSLRNTIDLHIANLQSFEQRYKKNKKKTKTSFYKVHSKQKQTSQRNIKSEMDIKKAKSRSTQAQYHQSPSPQKKIFSTQNSFHKKDKVHVENNLNLHNYIESNRFIKSKAFIPYPRVNFTYLSP